MQTDKRIGDLVQVCCLSRAHYRIEAGERPCRPNGCRQHRIRRGQRCLSRGEMSSRYAECLFFCLIERIFLVSAFFVCGEEERDVVAGDATVMVVVSQATAAWPYAALMRSPKHAAGGNGTCSTANQHEQGCVADHGCRRPYVHFAERKDRAISQ